MACWRKGSFGESGRRCEDELPGTPAQVSHRAPRASAGRMPPEISRTPSSASWCREEETGPRGLRRDRMLTCKTLFYSMSDDLPPLCSETVVPFQIVEQTRAAAGLAVSPQKGASSLP